MYAAWRAHRCTSEGKLGLARMYGGRLLGWLAAAIVPSFKLPSHAAVCMAQIPLSVRMPEKF